MKKRLVVLSDSLGRPRPEITGEDRTELDQVYGSILQTLLGDDWVVDLVYVDSLDSDDALFWNQRMVAYRRPDLVVFHFGINDCAPRLFAKGSRSLLLRPWFRALTRDLGFRVLSKFRRHVTRVRAMTYVPIERFTANLRSMRQEIQNYSPNCRFVAILIATPAHAVRARSHGYAANIQRYNAAIREVFPDHVDVDALLPNVSPLISDGIHLRPEAHRALAEKLQAYVCRSGECSCAE